MSVTDDYADDPLGGLNKLVNWAFSGKRPAIFRKLVSHSFAVIIPTLKHPLRLPHPYGIFINPAAKLGKNITVFQGVTIGSKRSGKRGGVPTIGDNVVIGINAVILGDVTIGDGAMIAPLSYVIHDVPAGAVVGPEPAKLLNGAAGALRAVA